MWKKERYKILWYDGPRKVTGYVSGPLAVNTNYFRNQFNSIYTITHLGTGYAVLSVRGRRLAMRIAERLLTLDWDFTDPELVPYRTMVICKRWRRAVKRCCNKNTNQ